MIVLKVKSSYSCRCSSIQFQYSNNDLHDIAFSFKLSAVVVNKNYQQFLPEVVSQISLSALYVYLPRL